jgi:hypothetical protein
MRFLKTWTALETVKCPVFVTNLYAIICRDACWTCRCLFRNSVGVNGTQKYIVLKKPFYRCSRIHFCLFLLPGPICMISLLPRHALDCALFQNLLAYFAEPSITWNSKWPLPSILIFLLQISRVSVRIPPLFNGLLKCPLLRRVSYFSCLLGWFSHVSSSYWRWRSFWNRWYFSHGNWNGYVSIPCSVWRQ